MATNGILDITTEEYMGQDPEMQIDQNEMIDIIKTLQIVGVPQDKHPEILEAFKEWKQTKNGTVDMFLEESFQLEPGTITKIKSQQMARGPEEMQTEEEMLIQPGSEDMQEIMQSVGAPQRAAEGGIMASVPSLEDSRNEMSLQLFQKPYHELTPEEIDILNDHSAQRAAEGGIMGGEFTKDIFNTGPVDRYDEEAGDIILEFMKRFPGMYTENMELKDMMAMLQAEGVMGVEGLGLSGLDQSLDMITPESVENSLQRISRGDTQYGDMPREMAQGGRAGYDAGGLAQKWNLIREMYDKVGGQQGTGMSIEEFALKYEMRAEGGRAGYADGDVILPQPKPRYWEQGDGAMRSMKGMMGTNRNDPRYQAMGMNLDAGAPQIYPEPKPMMPYMAQEQMQPFTEGVASVMPAGFNPITGQEGSFGQANDMGVQGMENVDMRVVMDFLMKMGMEPSQENIEKAIEALGVAAQYGQAVEDVNVDVDETIDMGYQHGGRAGYGLGSFVKSIVRAPKKILKSAKKLTKNPLVRAAALYIATAGASNYFAGAKGANWGNMFGNAQSRGWLNPAMVGSNVKESFSRLPFGKETITEVNKIAPAAGKMEADIAAIGAKKASDFTALEARKWSKYIDGLDKVKDVAKPWYKDPWKMIPLMSIGAGAYTQANPGETSLDGLGGERKEEVAEWDNWLASIGQNPSLYNFGRETTLPFPDYAEGGRINRAEGGIMDLDGMEKDFRNTGGFVDLGAKEKADDVPARLSVNEFVMTADAVRGAGDGDVDEGAERLQHTMKQLEQKGKRHKAAQGMFATSQRLGEVI